MTVKFLSTFQKMSRLIVLVIIIFTISLPSAFATTHTTKPHHKPKIKTTSPHTKTKTRVAENTSRRHHKITHKSTPTPTRIGQNKINTDNIGHSNLPLYVLSTIEQRLVSFVRNTISSIHYSSYKLGGTTIDSSRGIYVVDCSTYVDHILKTVYPLAYESLVTGTGTEKPTTDDYYDYFINLGYKSQTNWNTVEDVDELRPGDILVFRFKNANGRETGGHVMVVMDEPSHAGDTFFVRVADSAPTGHSQDTRLPRRSGIGIGTLMLKVDKDYQPYAYAWKEGAHWQRNVNFAMARPIVENAKG